jgi:hypothetical protein
MACCGKTKDGIRASGTRSGCVLCRIWCILTREPKTPEGDPCVVVPSHVIRKPDPCIYSQFLLMQLNQPVTWDNPDIRIFLGGVEQNTYDLAAGTQYDVEITVHNSSRDKPANGTAVNVGFIEFGAGAQIKHPIAALSANVPIWPGTAVVTTKWTTPTTPGHYCIEVELSHPDDANPANNRGWNNTQVHAAASPVERTIRVFNRYPGECPSVREGGGPWLRPHRVIYGWGPLGLVAALLLHRYYLHDPQPVLGGLAAMAAGYVILSIIGVIAESIYAWMMRRRREQQGTNPRTDRTDCHLVDIKVDSYEFGDKVGKDFDPVTAFQDKPPVWPAHITPSSFVFTAGEAFRDVVLHVDAPDTPGPPGVFNVSVMQGGVPSGGVTITITTGGP